MQYLDTSKCIRLLKTAKGQLDGIIRMIEDDRDYLDISAQIIAALAVIKKVYAEFLSGYMAGSIKRTFERGDAQMKRRKIEQFQEFMARVMR